MKIVKVSTGKPYEVRIERGLIARVGEQLRALTHAQTAAIITDDTVDALYGDTVCESLAQAGFHTCRMSFPHGEPSKNLQTYGKALAFLAENRLTRTDLVVALGGGVVGDLAGFAAATYLRGLQVAQVPTTLLAMVDSSVGGKTAVDLPAGKNLVGAFHQPICVLCDPDTLQTVPHDTLVDGVAEAIKAGVLCSEPLFETLATGDYDAVLEDVIEQCVRIKAEVVAADELDKGRRQLLNLGHTLGHAVERCSGYQTPHGHAVAIGMVYAARIAAGLRLCDESIVSRIAQALRRNDLPTESPYTAEQLVDVALSDKKRDGDSLLFVLPRSIGECELHPVGVAELPKLAAMALGK